MFGFRHGVEYRHRLRYVSHAELKMTNKNGKLVLVGEHIIKFLLGDKGWSTQPEAA